MDKPISTRLNKYLALHLGLSRREADEYVEQGRVKINDTPAILGAHVAPTDTVTLDSKPVSTDTDLQYMLLHKPAGYVCSRRPQGDNPTIYALLPKELHALKPVGRLDKDSSGLILLSNDGDFTHRMTHPSFRKTKTYLVQLDTPLQPLHQQMISDFGVMLEDGKSRFTVEKLDTPPENISEKSPITYRITMSEGRNRQIRRTFGALGYTVTYLHRTIFGDYSLGDISPGTWHFVDIS